MSTERCLSLNVKVRRENEPGDLLWFIATVSVVLPWLGVFLIMVGVFQVTRDDTGAWLSIVAGAACLVLDLLIDIWMAHPKTLASDLPNLNRRAYHFVGRIGVLGEPIQGGRGRAKFDDTIWLVEGPDLPAGARIKVTDFRGTTLVVRAAPQIEENRDKSRLTS